MSDLMNDVNKHLWQERRRMEDERNKWLYGTLNDVYRYQWRCIAFGGKSVAVTWRFKPRPTTKRFRLRTVGAFIRHWTSTSTHGSSPSRTNRATLYRRYGPFLRVIKPTYWSECHGCEPMLFHNDKEWSLDRWFEHRRRTMSDWTREDEDKERAYFHEHYGGVQP